jgi:hypothetical protein
MPEISLLQPTVLRGVVEKLTAPESLTLLNRLPRQANQEPTATWDVIVGSRMVAKPNVPNSEAHIVAPLGRQQETARFIYLREKKVFNPTTIRWIRTPGQIAATNAERAVLREVTDLNQRFDNFAEFCCWRALTGTLTLDYEDVQATVDYHVPTSHKPTPAVSWETATPQQIRSDIVAWTRLLMRDARVPATTASGTSVTLERVMSAFQNVPTLLSDRMKDQFWSSGTIPGFLGLNWEVVEQVYQTDGGVTTLFVPDDALYITNLTADRPMEILEGPTADDDAPENYTGKFSKTWKEKDPSARQFLLEWHFLPVIYRPEQIVYISDVAPAGS